MMPFADPAVAAVFAEYPAPARRKLLALRELIFSTAARTTGVGDLLETLKWGEPAYLTVQSGSGSTLRIAWKARQPAQVALYVNCQTTLVDTFRNWFPGELRFEGRRAIVFELAAPLPREAVALCIATTLTYHRARRAAASA